MVRFMRTGATNDKSIQYMPFTTAISLMKSSNDRLRGSKVSEYPEWDRVVNQRQRKRQNRNRVLPVRRICESSAQPCIPMNSATPEAVSPNPVIIVYIIPPKIMKENGLTGWRWWAHWMIRICGRREQIKNEKQILLQFGQIGDMRKCKGKILRPGDGAFRLPSGIGIDGVGVPRLQQLPHRGFRAAEAQTIVRGDIGLSDPDPLAIDEPCRSVGAVAILKSSSARHRCA